MACRLALLVLALTAAIVKPGSAEPITAYKCVASGTFRGTAGTIDPIGTVWHWTFSANGKCLVEDQIWRFSSGGAYAFNYGEFPGSATFSPNYPWGAWRMNATLTGDAGTLSFPQVWFGLGAHQSVFRIHSFDTTIPHPELGVGGQTGIGLIRSQRNTGTGSKPIIKAVLAFTFGTEELPAQIPPDAPL